MCPIGLTPKSFLLSEGKKKAPQKEERFNSSIIGGHMGGKTINSHCTNLLIHLFGAKKKIKFP